MHVQIVKQLARKQVKVQETVATRDERENGSRKELIYRKEDD